MDDIIKQQYREIPDILRQYINSAAFDTNIEEILKEHPLQQVQIDAYGVEVMLVLLQLESVESFTANIKHNMEIALRRAEDISKKTKQLIFLPIQEHLIQRVHAEETTGDGVAGDGVIHNSISEQDTTRAPREIPLREIEVPKKEETPVPQKPIVAPTPAEVVPTAKESVLQTPKMPEGDSLDIFKKRLQQPVHTPVEESPVEEGERPVANTNPSSKEDIASDPYKESVD